MDNIQLILYIVFLIGYFIFKLLTGKKNVTGQDTRKFDQDNKEPYGHPTEYEPYDPDAGRPKSFEEILEELTGGSQPKEERRARQEVRREVQPVEEEAEEWDVAPDPRSYETYNSEAYQNSVKDGSRFKTLDEMVDIENIETKIGEVEEIDGPGDSSASNTYLSMFASLEDAKKAVVMSEILNRKY